MDNRQNQSRYPFIKNNYYPGKLLHAGDFINEQNYVNGKLEFINQKFHGCGIIEGLNVQDNGGGMLRISSGSAIDSLGRILLVPRDVDINPEKLENYPGGNVEEFILGISYKEQVAEEERDFLSKELSYQKARIEETFALGAYSMEEWNRLRGGAGKGNRALTEETILFQNEEFRLVVKTPKVVPSDSIFRCCIEAQDRGKGAVSVGWRCRVKLQGAYFAASGRSFQMVEQKPMALSGSLQQDWEFYTEEARKFPVMLELSGLEILSEKSGVMEVETCQVCIDTALSFEEAAKRYLGDDVPGQMMEWLPLAWLKSKDAAEGKCRTYFAASNSEVRIMAVRPKEEEILKRALEENGIVDIRWRNLLKDRRMILTGQPEPVKASVPQPMESPAISVHSGVTIISVPKRYKRGQTLFSEEIAHGFPGERVFLWCGRVYEERNYAYWERSKTRYSVLYGAEELFAEGWDSGWEIEKQALRQDVDAGTFQIALTLSKGRWRNRCREVAVSWIAVKTT